MTSILTGDIINSKKTDSRIWLKVLKEILQSLGESPKNWEIYRGDSFQLEIEEFENALKIAFKIKSCIKTIENIDVRIAIGFGEKDHITKNITEANGEAFINSGFAFDHYLKKQTLAIKSPWKEFDEEINLSLELALLTIDSWTVNSAEVFKISLENPNLTQSEIAEILGITQGRVSERQKRAGFEPILKLEKHFRKVINQKSGK